MQEDGLMGQRLVCDVFQESGKEVWEFTITHHLRKSCKLAYQRKKLGEENKKAGKYKNEKDLKRKLKIDKIQEVNKMQN